MRTLDDGRKNAKFFCQILPLRNPTPVILELLPRQNGRMVEAIDVSGQILPPMTQLQYGRMVEGIDAPRQILQAVTQNQMCLDSRSGTSLACYCQMSLYDRIVERAGHGQVLRPGTAIHA